MKKFLCVLFSCIFTCYLWAEYWVDEHGLMWKYSILSNGTVCVGDNMNPQGETAIPSSTVGHVVVPSKINGLDVTEIGSYAFARCNQLTSITILKGVTSINSYAFSECSQLGSITIPESVKTIGDYAFYKSGLSGIVKLPGNVSSVGDYAFAKCVAIELIKIECLRNVFKEYVFSECTSLKHVEFPEGWNLLPRGTFYKCTSLESVVLPQSLITVYPYAFYNCISLRECVISSALRAVGKSAFENCSLLKLSVEPECISRAEERAFFGCTSIEQLTIPDSHYSKGAFCGVCRIKLKKTNNTILEQDSTGAIYSWHGGEDYTLHYIPSSLKTFTVPENVTLIDDFTLACSQRLERLVIPGRIQAFDLFYGTGGVFFQGNQNELFNDQQGAVYSSCSDGTLCLSHVPAGCKSFVIPYSVSQITKSAFYNQLGTQIVFLNSSVEKRDHYAIYNWATFEDVLVLGKSNRQLATWATNSSTVFHVLPSEVENWKKVLPESTHVEPWTVYRDSQSGLDFICLEKGKYAGIVGKGTAAVSGDIVLPSHVSVGELNKSYEVRFIDANVFRGCTGLRSVVIPNTIIWAGENCFAGCNQVQRLEIHSPDFEHADSTFDGVSPIHFIGTALPEKCDRQRLLSVGIPQGTEKIGMYAFKGCDHVSELVLPDTVRYVDYGAFSAMQLKRLEVQSTNIEFSPGAFMGSAPVELIACKEPEGLDVSAVQFVSFPKGARRILANAFSHCNNVEEVRVPAKIESISPTAMAVSAKYVVESGNMFYSSDDQGVLYDKDQHILVSVPRTLISFVLPNSIWEIEQDALYNAFDLKDLYISRDISNLDFSLKRETTVHIFPMFIKRWRERFKWITFMPWGMRTYADLIEYCEYEGKAYLYRYSDCNASSITIPTEITDITTSMVYPLVSILDRAFANLSRLETVTFGPGIHQIGDGVFENCSRLKEIVFQNGLEQIGAHIVYDCPSLKQIVIPASVSKMSVNAFDGYNGTLEFLGLPPEGFEKSELGQSDVVHFPPAYEKEWKHAMTLSGHTEPIESCTAVEVTSEMVTPKKMRICYRIRNGNMRRAPRVHVLAFGNGIRSFANVLKIRNGTQIPDGCRKVTDEKHEFYWDIAKDWTTDIDRISVEVLLQENSLLPQNLSVIPGNKLGSKKTISDYRPSKEQIFSALLWCYAEDKTGRLKLIEGKLIDGVHEKVLAEGAYVTSEALAYVYEQMGFRILAGKELIDAERVLNKKFETQGFGRAAIADGDKSVGDGLEEL